MWVIIIKKTELANKIRTITNSMRFTMIATYLAVIVTTLILMCVYTIGLLNNNLYHNENVSMFAKANIIAQTVSRVWDNDITVSNDKFSGPVEQSLAGTNIRGVIVNKSYIVLYDTNRESEMSGKVFIRDVLKKALDGQQVEETSGKGTDESLMAVAVPVKKDGEIVGGVYLAVSVNNIASTVSSAGTSLVVFSVLIIILIGMLGLGISYVITSPMAEFRETARKISKGDFKARVKVKGKNEIAQMGETLNYMAQELEEMENKRKDFVSDVSHELRTPMTGIKLLCDSLRSIDDPDMRNEFIDDISDEIDRLSRLVEKLLTLSRLDSGKIEMLPADIKGLIRSVVKNLTPVAEKKNIKIYTDYEGIEPLMIVMDYDKMYEAMYNIADNAIKYSPENGYLHIEIRKFADHVFIDFEDNGPGIPEDEREKIFERFYRLDDSRARDTGGTGLGLAITREAVIMHGGEIVVMPAKTDTGSIFRVTLPLNNGEENP